MILLNLARKELENDSSRVDMTFGGGPDLVIGIA